MKLYTRTGDKGETSLFDGTRVAKDHPRIEVCGELDELNALLGWCRAATKPGEMESRIGQIQQHLFGLGSELATPPERGGEPPASPISNNECRELEGWIDQASETAGPLRNFILPGGTELACRLHLARTCCRRAERTLVTLSTATPLRPEVLVYVNRLSDLLFAWARLANHEDHYPDVIWTPQP